MSDSEYLISIVARLRDEASDKIRNLQRAVDELKAKAAGEDATADLRQGLDDTAQSAERATQAHRDLQKQQEEMRRSSQRTADDVGRSAQAHGAAAENVATHAASHEVLGESSTASSAALKEVADRARDTSGAMRAAERDTSSLSQAQQKLVQRGDELVAQMGRLDAGARSHVLTNKELDAGYKQVQSGLRKVRAELEYGTTDFLRFGNAMDQAGKKAASSDLARAGNDVEKLAQRVRSATDSIGVKIESVLGKLRGLSLVGLFQPLVTGATSLAASLFSVASGAAQAAATIGGVFLSGLGQMIPMLSIGIAALERFASVFEAVKTAEQARQQAYFEPSQGLITQLQNTNQLIESEQSLANAHFTLRDAQVQVRESQIALTQARIDAIRNIQDLVFAEKDAQLQLRGANLSLTQAEEQLRVAQATGQEQQIAQAQLAVQQAQLARQQAVVGVPRSQQNLALALQYGVSGSAAVLSANEAYRQSLLGVVQAEQQIAMSERQIRITRLQLAQPASQMSQQQATLKFLESQMNAPEKALFNVLNRLDMMLRSPNSPLQKMTGYIVQPFVNAGARLESLLGNRSFLAPLDRLAQAMGGELSKIEQAMFGRRGTSFFETMAKDATSSIPAVTSAITGLMHVFEDLATAAAPAFKRLSEDWARFWNSMDARDRTAAGQARLTEFFNQGAKWAENFAHLARSIFDLFMALGHDAAPQGMATVTTFADSVQRATEWVKSHGPEVTRFFSDARQALSAIGGVLLNIGRALIAVFSLTSLTAFTQLLNTVVIPAAQLLAQILGFLVTNFMRLLNAIGPLKDIIVALAAAFLGLLVINRVIGALTTATNVVHGLRLAFLAFQQASDASFFSRLATAWDVLTQRITKGRDATAAAAAAQRDLAATMQTTTGAEIAEEATLDAEITSQVALERAAAAGMGDMALTAGGGSILASANAAGTEPSALEGAGAGGVLSRVLGGAGPFALAGGLGAGAGLLYNSLFPVAQGKTGAGLASLLGPLGASQVIGGGNFLSDLAGRAGALVTGHIREFISNTQPGQVNKQLRSLQSGLNGISDPTQLSTQRLNALYQQSLQILQMPDITATQRRGLQQLVQQLDPANVEMQKAAQQWGATFQGINATTGNVMQQVQQTLKADVQNINANLQMGTVQGAAAFASTISSAYQTVLSNTSLTARGVQRGLQQIGDMLNHALHAVGAAGPGQSIGLKQFSALPGGQQVGLLTGQLTLGGVSSPHAAGGWHSATPGGRVIQVGEGGHDEVTLTTDPRYAPRQQALLGAYLSRVMAKGGYVGTPSVYQSPFGNSTVNWGRTDMGVDLNLPVGTPIGTIGSARVAGVLPNWYAGQPLVYYQLTDGPDAGRYVYVAEQISGVPGVSSSDPRATSSLQSEVGKRLGRGQRIGYYATAGTGIETGWATASGSTLAQATTGYTEGRQTSAGASFRSFLQGLQHGIITGGATAMQIVAPKLSGVSGAVGAIGQGALNTVASAANRFLSSAGGAAGMVSSAGITPGSWLSVARQIAARRGWNAAQVRAWQGVENIEDSAYSLTAKNPTSSAYGLAQFIGGPGEYAQYGGNAGTLVGQLTAMANYIAQRYGTPVAALVHERSAGWYAAGGLLTRHLRRMGIRHLRRHVLRMDSGGRAPWGGEPVPIVAHEGERISNPPQWDHIASLAGMTGPQLDHHLGYDTGSPRQHFAPGGVVTGSIAGPTRVVTSNAASRAASALSTLITQLTAATTNLATSDPGSAATGLSAILALMTALNRALGLIGNLGKGDTSAKLTQLNTLITTVTNPTDGLLLQLANAFQRFQSNLTNWVTSVGYGVQRVPLAGIGSTRRRGTGLTFSGTGFGGVTFAGPQLSAGNIGQTGQSALDELNVRAQAEQTQYLQDQQKEVERMIREVTQRIAMIKRERSRGKISRAAADKALSGLGAAYTNLIQQSEQLASAISQSVTSTFQVEQQRVQDQLTQVADVYQTQQQQLQSSQSGMETLGQYGPQLTAISQALVSSAQGQIAALMPVLQEAQRINDPDLVAQIQQQISQLQQTVTQTTAQMIQDQIAGVQQAAQTSQAQVSSMQSIAQTMFSSAGSQGQFQAAGALAGQALQLNQASLQSQLQSYNNLLGTALSTGNQGAVATLTQAIDQVTAALATNAQAIQDNTAQMVSQEAQFAQARGQFATGTLSGLGQIITTIGQTTGFTDVAALKGLATGQNAALQGTNSQLLGQLSQLGGGASGLAALLGAAATPQAFAAALGGANVGSIESGQSQVWISAFESIVSSLTQNTEAIATNNQQLATLNGQLLQPQQWSSSAWTAFRTAIFSGMGNLLPQFQSVLPSAATPMIAPIFSAVPTTSSPTIGMMNINHVPGASVNPGVLGEQIAFEVANALG